MKEILSGRTGGNGKIEKKQSFSHQVTGSERSCEKTMDLPVSQAQSGGGSLELGFEDETEESLQGPDQFHGDSGGSAGEGGSPATSRGSGDGSLRDRPPPTKEDLPCPRCQSLNTKFCYYNNYSVNQPRYFCRNCQRYWTVGGTLRNVPVGGGSRKKTRSRSRNITNNNNDNTYLTRIDHQHAQPTDHHHGHHQGLPADLHHMLMQHHHHHGLSHESPLESMPAPSLGFGPGGFNPHPASQMSFLQFLEQNQPEVYAQVMEISLSRHLEAADLQALCYETQAAAAAAAAAMAMNHGGGYYSPEEMEKAAVWAQIQQLQKLAMRQAWEEQQQQQQQSLQSKPLVPSQQSLQREQSPAIGFEDILSSQQQAAAGNMSPRKPGFWETALMHSRPVMGKRFSSETNIPPSSETEDPGNAMANDGYSHGHDAYEDASNSSWGEMNAADMYYH